VLDFGDRPLDQVDGGGVWRQAAKLCAGDLVRLAARRRK
jgi:hypothetical protein